MLPEIRQSLILELLEKRGNITSNQIAEQLKISVSTIWRDLNALSLKGKVSKIHGGAIIRKKTDDFEFLFSTRLKKNVEDKRKIAKRAASLVEPYDVIAIDTGTTATLFASYLKSMSNISVITASLGVVQELRGAKGVYTVLLGGDVKEESMSTVGSMTLEHIKSLRIHKYFVGAAAIDSLRGTQDAYLFEREIKKELVSISKERIVIADSTKFGRTSLAVVVDLGDIDIIITDNKVRETYKKSLKKSGIEVIIV